MSEETSQAPSPVRGWLLIHSALKVLSEVGPLRRSEVLAAVGDDLASTFTDYEKSRYRESDETPRWATALTWCSTDMKAAGWITKRNGVWAITEEGRGALLSHPNGEGLEVDSARAYRDLVRTRNTDRSTQPRYAAIIDSALEYIQEGQWASYSDLAELAATNPATVGTYMGQTNSPAAHRILGKDGRRSPGFVWADPMHEGSQRAALEDEGLTFDSSGAADEARHVRAGDLRDLLENVGVLEKLPRRAWMVRGSSVDGHDLVPQWTGTGFVSLRASKLREVEPDIERTVLKQVIDDDYSATSYAYKAAKLDEFHDFLSRMQIDDIVTTTSQGRLFLGVIAGPAEYVKSTDGLSNLRRPVNWLFQSYAQAELAGALRSRLQVQSDVVELTPQLDLLERMLIELDGAATGPNTEPNPPEDHPALVLTDATRELADSLHVDKPWMQECIELLRDRPQLIFYGPPGTGKTYIAQALAHHLAGDNVRLVQFHPAYSYEDFFEGYRPAPGGGFELKPGPLRKAVEVARDNPSVPYVLIIDEINRGNLAKIFGELYFLLEYRNENVDLLYATDDDAGFTLPENLFIIGTMNTADRSIALVDAAMRRRFAFVPLHPSEAPTRDVLRRWLTATERDSEMADLLDALNDRIEDPDFKIGPSYFMRDSVYQPGGLERTWRTSILPLLEEHHYGDGTDVRARYGLDAIRAAAKKKADDTGAEDAGSTDPA